MKKHTIAAPGRLGSFVLALALCVALLAQGITREVPYGGLDGTVVMRENGRALPDATVILRPNHGMDWDELQAMPEEDRPRSYVTETDEEGKFAFRAVAAGDYFLEASGKAHSIETLQISVAEGKPVAMSLELEPSAPYLDIYANQHVFTPEEEIKVQVHGFVEAGEVQFDVYRLDVASIVSKGTVRATLEPFSNGAVPPDAQRASRVTLPVEGRDLEGTFRQFFRLPELQEGMYWVVCGAGDLKKGTYLNVTRIAMVTKAARGKLTTFVTEISTGAPISGASVGVADSGKLKNGAITAPDGLAELALGQDRSGYVGAIATHGGSSAFVDLYQGADEGVGQVRFFVYADRSIYRPGDEVHFKGILRKLTGSTYSTPGTGTVQFEIRDADQTLVEKGSLPVSSAGTYAGSFRVNGEASPGSFAIKSRFGEAESTDYVTIAAYRKPEYSITVRPERPYFVRGERARMVVEAEYYFGSPVAGAEVTASIYREPLWDWGTESGEEGEEAYEGGYGGEWIEEIKATTDSNGRAVIEFGTRHEDAWDDQTDTVYSVDASVTDGDKYFSGRGSVKVVRGGFGLAAESHHYVVDEGQPVEVVIRAYRHENKDPRPNVEIKLVSGYEVWTDMESVFRPTETRTVRTGPDGTARASFSPRKGGSFRIKAEARDDRGNTIGAESFVWVYAGASESYGPPVDLDLKLDKKAYRVGDTAKVLIRCARHGGSALVTVEGERVYYAKVVKLEGPTTEVELPITDDYRPNAFVTVAYVKDKKFGSRQRRFGVDLGLKRLAIDIRSDKAVYKPGETATYSIATADEAGRPVAADLSLGIVDEAIYAIAEDRTDIVEGFYPKRYNQVTTGYSFEEIYLDGGDKAPGDIPIRSKFRDTAFWMPTVRTDATGRATVRVQLPDNLTTWRATAVGATADTAVGQTIQKVRARKDLMVRLLTPAFFVQQDSQRLLAMVTNDTGRDADVNVQIAATGVLVDGSARRSLGVRAGETKSIEWTMSAPDAGAATITAKAWSGSFSDGVQATFEVQPHGRTFTDVESGEVRGTAEEKLAVRPGAHPGFGSLTIHVSPSVATGLLQSLDELIGFPYGCVEQTMSRFMPTVVVAKLLADFRLPKPKLAARIPEMVAEGYARLRKMQHADGGWGWWENDASNLFMTALVLEGLHRARAAGFEPNPAMAERAIAWAKQELPKRAQATSEWRAHDDESGRIYLLYALGLWGESGFASKYLTVRDFIASDAYDAANLALLYGNLGKDWISRRDAALAKMIGLANDSSGAIHWPERYWGNETTGRCLLALSSIRPDDPRIPSAVRGLMLARRGGYWYSTRDTSFVIVALAEYLRATGSLVENAELRVLLNDREVRKYAISPDSILNPDLRIDIPIVDLRQGENVVRFEKSGAGACFYSIQLRQTVVEELLPPMTSVPGLSVTRSFHALTTQRMENGTLRLMPSDGSVSHAERGDILRCSVQVTTEKPRQFVMLEVPIPSNCRVTERAEIGPYEEWTWWFDKLVVRDDRVAFFVQNLPIGTHQFTFAFRAENSGVGHALPAVIANMYDTSERASSAESTLEVSGP